MIKIWTWIKTYWKPILIVVILLIIAIITFTIFKRGKYHNIIKTFHDAKESYEKQIAVIEFENNKEKILKKKVNDDYEKLKEEMKKRHNIELEKLKTKQQKEIKEKVKQYGNDQESLIKEISKEYNIQIYKSNTK